MQFLVKPADVSSKTRIRSLPIVFLHGLGIGMGQYIGMLDKLARHRDVS